MEVQSYQKTKNKMAIGYPAYPHISIITHTVNRLNLPKKKAQSNRLDQKPKSNDMLPSADIVKWQKQS